VILGVGAADAMPVATPTRAIGANRRARRVRRSNAALIVTLTARRARWQRIAVSR
jgi:hypothetical protein